MFCKYISDFTFVETIDEIRTDQAYSKYSRRKLFHKTEVDCGKVWNFNFETVFLFVPCVTKIIRWHKYWRIHANSE